jgi:hypothetical protein
MPAIRRGDPNFPGGDIPVDPPSGARHVGVPGAAAQAETEEADSTPETVRSFLLRIEELLEHPKYAHHEMALRALASEIEERQSVSPLDEHRLAEIVDPLLLQEAQTLAGLEMPAAKLRMPMLAAALRAAQPPRLPGMVLEAEGIAQRAAEILAERLAEQIWKKRKKDLLGLVNDERVKELFAGLLVEKLRRGFEE